jgi:hypothetical protein
MTPPATLDPPSAGQSGIDHCVVVQAGLVLKLSLNIASSTPPSTTAVSLRMPPLKLSCWEAAWAVPAVPNAPAISAAATVRRTDAVRNVTLLILLLLVPVWGLIGPPVGSSSW